MSFEEAFRNLEKESQARALNILIWGPGEGAGEHYKKRQKIRTEIGKRFVNSDVRFSEELDLSKILHGVDETDVPLQELWHLAACDICVVLDTSKGAGEEIAYFARSRHSHKLLVLTHEKYRRTSSFPNSLRKYHNQLFYDDEAYDTCNLVERVLDRIRDVSFGRLIGFEV